MMNRCRCAATLVVALGVAWVAAAHPFGLNHPAQNVDTDAPYLVVLGIAQDGGYPQPGCAKECCAPAWNDPSLRRFVVSLGIVDPAHEGIGARWMIEATPDFRDQLRLLDEHSPTQLRSGGGSPDLTGIFLTHAHIGHYTGLMHLGHEAMGASGVPVYAMPRMREFLSTNGPWDQLVRFKNIELRELVADQPVTLNERISITSIRVPHRDEYSETVGFRVEGPSRSVLFIPDIDKWERWDRQIKELIREVDVAYLDATFYADGEIPHRAMEDIPHPFIVESMERFADLPADIRSRVRFIHLNHTNPALRAGTDAAKAIGERGFRIAQQGERVDL